MNFGSDNTTGVSVEVLDALQAANTGHATPYGGDEVTARVESTLAALFETPVFVFLVPTGTAANALSLAVLSPPYGAVYCHASAHIHTDECGAPEFYTGGAKMVPLSAGRDKLQTQDLATVLSAPDRGIHHVQPAAVSLSQAAETGVVYRPDDVAAIAEAGRSDGLRLHMDGARFANALVTLNCPPADVTWKAGVDLLSFGASKNGAMMVEAIVVFDAALAERLGYLRKRGGHLASKMRFLSAQFEAYLRDDLWLRNARHANAVATRLAAGVSDIPGLKLAWPTQANEVFFDAPASLADALEAGGFGFYRWPTEGGEDKTVRIRLVTAFDTNPAHADAFLDAARRHTAPPSP